MLPMPNRPLTELMIASPGSTSGPPSSAPRSTCASRPTPLEELVEAAGAPRRRSDSSESLPQWVVAALWEHRLLGQLLESAAGREALTAGRLQAYAAWRIGEARRRAAWSGQFQDETAPAAIAMLLIAQAWFVASRGVTGEPSRAGSCWPG